MAVVQRDRAEIDEDASGADLESVEGDSAIAMGAIYLMSLSGWARLTRRVS
jgi:hypothetical protein